MAGGFIRAITDGERPIAKAATAAVRETAEMAKSAGRASIAGAGFSRKWQNALRAKIYPPNRDSMRAAALIYHKVPYAEVFEDGAVIHGIRDSCGEQEQAFLPRALATLWESHAQIAQVKLDHPCAKFPICRARAQGRRLSSRQTRPLAFPCRPYGRFRSRGNLATTTESQIYD